MRVPLRQTTALSDASLSESFCTGQSAHGIQRAFGLTGPDLRHHTLANNRRGVAHNLEAQQQRLVFGRRCVAGVAAQVARGITLPREACKTQL